MALFDQFGAGQAGNGQAAPNPQMTQGAPGFQFGSWGNQPPNMAAGLQQFLAARGMARPQPGGPGMPGQPPQPQPQPGMPPQGGPMPVTQSIQGGQTGGGMNNAQPMPGGPPAATLGSGGNLAGGMQQFLGARPA